MEFRDAISELERIFLRQHVVHLHLPGCPVRNCIDQAFWAGWETIRARLLFKLGAERALPRVVVYQYAHCGFCMFLSIEVMLVGARVYGIKYSIPEYVCTFLVAGGVSSFALLKVWHFPSYSFASKSIFFSLMGIQLLQWGCISK
ncbi:hypothetical protein ZIOFF_000872 [Zingiber officinale]|uniref:Uncharacterized protein n=1 Tax=Zingiber officinale TaxID=94328 RepID=A0A8J5I534_ZINOF|nr:hypothetical protein ZIOFF_000872 [Zingiber officinale]